MHVIRLRSNWESTPEGWRRRFHKPTGLEGGDRVSVAVDGPATVVLNGQPLPLVDGRGDVTELLTPANELLVQPDQASQLESVRLEIEPV